MSEWNNLYNTYLLVTDYNRNHSFVSCFIAVDPDNVSLLMQYRKIIYKN